MTDEWLVYYKSQSLETPVVPALTQGDGDSLANDIELEATEQSLVLTVTEEQYVQLLSSALNGAQETYPENWLDVLYPLIKAGKTVLCDAIADCIANSANTQEAINNLLAGNSLIGTGNPNGTFPEIGAEVLYDGTVTCDNDAVYAMALQLTDFVNNTAVDFFQLFEAVTNDAEYVSSIISAIPIVGILPVDEIIDLAQNYAENIGENYLAAYNEALRREISCTIFCAILDNGCYVTFGELANIFLEQFLLEFITVDLQDIFDLVTQGIFAGTEFVYAMYATIFAFLGIGTDFLGLNAEFVTKVVQAMSNDSDPDWMTYCTDCNDTWCVLFDFSNPDGTVNLMCGTPSGTVLSSNDVLCGGAYFARLDVDFFPNFQVTKVEASITVTGDNPQLRTVLQIDNGVTNRFLQQNNPASAGTYVYTYEPTAPTFIDHILVYGRNGTTGSPPTADTAVINYLLIQGEGTNPFSNAVDCP